MTLKVIVLFENETIVLIDIVNDPRPHTFTGRKRIRNHFNASLSVTTGLSLEILEIPKKYFFPTGEASNAIELLICDEKINFSSTVTRVQLHTKTFRVSDHSICKC